MPLEIEHKFLLKNNDWEKLVSYSNNYKQGYLVSDNKRSLRIRTTNSKAWINIKSATIGPSRQEYEYEIPFAEGVEIMKTLCEKPLIEKTRHFVPYLQHTWEIDVFSGDNEGLIVAEIELSRINEPFHKPDWLGVEVTEDRRYYNNELCKNPFKSWKTQ